MPLRSVALYDVLFELRELVFPTRVTAAIFDDLNPGLFSGYAAGAAHLCWIAGELPLWAVAQDGGLEQVAWRRGRFIDWPDTTADVAITEYRGVGLIPHLLGEGDPPLHRREDITTSTAGAERLKAFVRSEIPEDMPDAALAEWIRKQGARSEEQLTLSSKQLGKWKPSRPRLRRVHASVKNEDAALKPGRGPRPKQ